ncbi:ankyrin repeat-containing domain protein [Mycena galopus ATCC 62051]|nr:ankyrin repeat-containing domain protein [Mycena galopus ATCC 62051]
MLAVLFAVEHDLESTLDKLIAAGISIDAKFTFTYHQSWASGHGCQIVGMHGENMAARVYIHHTRFFRHWWALEHAVHKGHKETIRTLAPISLPSFGGNAQLSALISAGADIHAKDAQHRSVLTYFEVLRFYLECGVDPDIEDNCAQTALHYACAKLSWTGNVAVRILLEFGATTVEKTDHESCTPVDIAMRWGGSDVVKMLEPLVQDSELEDRISKWW